MVSQKNINNFSYHLLIKLTSKCNLNCYNCATACSNSMQHNYELNLQTFETNLIKIKNVCKNLTNIVLTGGEPLLYPHFIKACEITRKIFPQNSIVIFSNGLLLNKFSDEEILKLKKMNIIFSISLYPNEKILKKLYNDISYLESKGIHFESYYDKSRPYFFKGGYTFTAESIEAKKNFDNCLEKYEYLFSLIEDKIFNCPTAILFYNLNYSFSPNDYIGLNDLYSEEQLYKLSNTAHDMCKNCGKKNNLNNGKLIWHMQSEIPVKENYEDNLLDLFLYNYPVYNILQNNEDELKKALNDPIFDISIMKEKEYHGYKQLRNKYFDGIADILIIVNNTNNDNQLSKIIKLLLIQNNLKKYNFYIGFEENISIDKQKNFLITSSQLENCYYFKEKKEKIIQKFFEISHLNKYFIINLNDTINILNKNFLNERIQLKK